ncbi:MAG: dephospho-CoA kinase [Faecalicoccus sp.]|nr:dephospho-CoA kinase [Faecalicoccus sp.]
MPKMSKKKVIGLTGSMGSGKSMAASIIREYYPVLDCDRVNRDLLKKGHAGYSALLAGGFDFLDDKGEIDKPKMASVIFNDEIVRKKVESILHPLIFKEMEIWISKQNAPLIFVEMPLLFEIGAQSYFDEIWCVVSNREIALKRLEEGRNISSDEALARWNAQLSPELKMAQSSYVIYNNGTVEQLRQQLLDGMEESLHGA